MKSLLNIFIFSFLLFFLFHIPVFADSKFSTSVDLTYTVTDSGLTHVVAKVIIKNTTQQYYVTSYTLKLGFSDLKNLHANDNGGPIIPVIQKTDTGEDITLQLNSAVYGAGTTVPFTLSFDTSDIASKNGSVWEVNIPGISDKNDFSEFNVHVTVPPSFGSATYTKPDVGKTLDFSKNILGKSGISIGFGTQQLYAYSLIYHLQNKNLFPIKTEVALPPTTNYQHVFLNSLTPSPQNVRIDTDGNWIASYLVLPSQTMNVVAKGNIQVLLSPEAESLSDSQRKLYLKEQPYWEVNNTNIRDLAQTLKTPYTIYQYVVKHLTYDFSRVNTNQERLGAFHVLENPNSAVCLEFADLFVALARAAGIPAREIDGYAYTQNTRERPLSLVQDILHAWPEYYDDSTKRWVMVDPTWSNTTGGVDYFHTLDFDHVAFVVKGIDSKYPIPAGGYKLAGQEKEKDVDMSFASQLPYVSPAVSMGLSMNNFFFAGLPISGSIIIKNTTPALFPSQSIKISTTKITPVIQYRQVPAVPPYGQIEVPFSFNKTSFLTNANDTVTIALAANSLKKSITIALLTPMQLIIGGGIILVISSIIIFIITSRSRRVSVF